MARRAWRGYVIECTGHIQRGSVDRVPYRSSARWTRDPDCSVL